MILDFNVCALILWVFLINLYLYNTIRAEKLILALVRELICNFVGRNRREAPPQATVCPAEIITESL